MKVINKAGFENVTNYIVRKNNKIYIVRIFGGKNCKVEVSNDFDEIERFLRLKNDTFKKLCILEYEKEE